MKKIKFQKEIGTEGITYKTFYDFTNILILDYEDIVELFHLLTENKEELRKEAKITFTSKHYTETIQNLSLEKFKKIIDDKIDEIYISITFIKDKFIFSRSLTLRNNSLYHYFSCCDDNEMISRGIGEKLVEFIQEHTSKRNMLKKILFPINIILASLLMVNTGIVALLNSIKVNQAYIFIGLVTLIILTLLSSIHWLFKKIVLVENKNKNRLIEYFKSRDFINTIIGTSIGAVLGSIITIIFTQIISK